MKIIKLQAENIKKLKAIEISPEGNVVYIHGDNGAGKSSVLDSIAYALGGKKLIPSKPIRDGEKNATIKVELDNGLTIERTFTELGSTLKVTAKDGGKYGQEKLSGLLKTFDPTEFIQLNAKDQREKLSELLGIKDKLDGLRTQRQALYDARTAVGRNRDQAKGELSGYEIKEPVEQVNVSELNQKLSAELQKASKLNEIKNQRSHKEWEIENFSNDIAEINSKLVELQKSLLEKTKMKVAAEGELAIIVNSETEVLKGIDPNEADNIRKQLESAAANNQRAIEYNRYKDAEDRYQKLEAEYKDFTHKINVIDIDAFNLIKSSKMPIEGLSIEAAGVYYNGVPFEQLSTGERLKISTAIAMAANPELKIMLMRDGSLVDNKNFQIIAEMAKDKDYQLWYEDVNKREGVVGFLIDEGEIK